jgi:regulator of sigma E protease
MIHAIDLWRYLLLAMGLGFVVFFHELGHFLAAKYSGVKVEQFALGFGHAVVAWRKGIGVRNGTTAPEVEKRVNAHLETQQGERHPTRENLPFSNEEISRAMTELGIGETEYRLNWMPLGGYVKMLGQDDLNPNSKSTDPRAYNNKPIRSRMLIVSAGVLMNVLLAAIGFMVVFLMGFKTAPAMVGGVLAGSPASLAQRDDGTRCPLAVGDRILYFDGKYQHDFAKVALTVALAGENESIPMVLRHHDAKVETVYVTPVRPDGDPQGLLSLGVMPPRELRGPDISAAADVEDDLSDRNLFPADVEAVQPGDTITAINGEPVAVDDYWKLDQAMADSDGQRISLTIKSADGSTRQAQVSPHFQSPFGADDLSIAGMTPRARVAMVADKKSPAYGLAVPGDVIQSIKQISTGTVIDNSSPQALREAINAAGQEDKPIVLTLINAAGASRQTPEMIPSIKLPDDRRGLDVQLGCDEQHAVVAAVAAGSAAEAAGIKPGWTITKVNGQSVSNWFQVRRILAAAKNDQPLAIDALTPGGPATVHLALDSNQLDTLRAITCACDLALHERTELRKTSNPLVAAMWGASETRDFILQFYVTLRRMIGGSVSYKQAMGPVGIVRFGAMSAARGTDWLVWFLAMISANLAVANFLPIPVMDGGLFVLLILEGFQGRPLSAKTQQVIQFVGLAIILSLFLLVTYQDITRPFGHG